MGKLHASLTFFLSVTRRAESVKAFEAQATEINSKTIQKTRGTISVNVYIYTLQKNKYYWCLVIPFIKNPSLTLIRNHIVYSSFQVGSSSTSLTVWLKTCWNFQHLSANYAKVSFTNLAMLWNGNYHLCN